VPVPPVTAYTPGFGKEITNAAKLHTKELKYTGISGNFDYMLTVFKSICQRCDVPPKAYVKAMPNMLSGLALNHYFNATLNTMPFDTVCQHICNFFKGVSL
jgi:hypothetical protein